MNPEKVPLNTLAVYGFWSHKPARYPQDRQWFACFNNWYPSTFKLTLKEGEGDEITFNCVEQQMMYFKAMLFNDKETAALILKEVDPAKLKDLGRKVKNYDDRTWSKARYEIVTRGVKAKFEQNADMKQNLLLTGTKTLAEASPYDKVWGIGLAPTDPKTQDPVQWQGLNLLGKGLMEVRDGF